eukprot:g1588.t1
MGTTKMNNDEAVRVTNAAAVRFEIRRKCALDVMRSRFVRLFRERLGAYHFPVTEAKACDLDPPREALNRFIFSRHEESLAEELSDDLPVKLPNWKKKTYHPFCSFFAEDRDFGSLGRFEDLKLDDERDDRGADDFRLFEVNPPFDVHVIENVLRKVEEILGMKSTSTSPLASTETDFRKKRNVAFLLVIPEWLEQGSFRPDSPIDTLLRSNFLQASIVKRPHKHSYVKGRCWHWSKLPLERGPPSQPGVSKSRMSVFADGETVSFLGEAVSHAHGDETGLEDRRAFTKNRANILLQKIVEKWS